LLSAGITRASAGAGLFRNPLHALVGCFSSSKQSQLKDLEETIHVLKPYVTKPLTLCFNGGKDIILLILIVSFLNLACCLAVADIALETPEVVNKEAVKKLAP
jgi:hypothetical protein